MILLRLYLAFLQIGLFSVGGGYAAIPLIQEQTVVQNGWLTLEAFSDLVTIAEMTPGPIAINASTFVGSQIAGLAGSLVATLGCITPSLVIVSILAWAYRRFGDAMGMQKVLKSLRPAVVALIASAGLSIAKVALARAGYTGLSSIDPFAVALFALALLCLRGKKWNPILVMAACGAANLIRVAATGGL